MKHFFYLVCALCLFTASVKSKSSETIKIDKVVWDKLQKTDLWDKLQNFVNDHRLINEAPIYKLFPSKVTINID